MNGPIKDSDHPQKFCWQRAFVCFLHKYQRKVVGPHTGTKIKMYSLEKQKTGVDNDCCAAFETSSIF